MQNATAVKATCAEGTRGSWATVGGLTTLFPTGFFSESQTSRGRGPLERQPLNSHSGQYEAAAQGSEFTGQDYTHHREAGTAGRIDRRAPLHPRPSTGTSTTYLHVKGEIVWLFRTRREE
jgi:hypothetical protein